MPIAISGSRRGVEIPVIDRDQLPPLEFRTMMRVKAPKNPQLSGEDHKSNEWET